MASGHSPAIIWHITCYITWLYCRHVCRLSISNHHSWLATSRIQSNRPYPTLPFVTVDNSDQLVPLCNPINPLSPLSLFYTDGKGRFHEGKLAKGCYLSMMRVYDFLKSQLDQGIISEHIKYLSNAGHSISAYEKEKALVKVLDGGTPDGFELSNEENGVTLPPLQLSSCWDWWSRDRGFGGSWRTWWQSNESHLVCEKRPGPILGYSIGMRLVSGTGIWFEVGFEGMSRNVSCVRWRCQSWVVRVVMRVHCCEPPEKAFRIIYLLSCHSCMVLKIN